MKYRSVILQDRPLRYWRQAETSGTVARDETGNANGTINGTVTLSQQALIKGDPAGSMLFDGNNGYISASTTGLPSGANPWSLEAWVKMATLPIAHNYNMFLSFGDYSNHAKATLGYYVPGTCFILDFFGDQMGSFVPSANGVYYVAGTYDGTNARLYVNAVQTDIKAEAMNIALTFCTIGAGNNGPSDQYPALSSNSAIYGYCLTPDQVKNHYRTGLYQIVRSPHQGFARIA